MTDVTEDRDQAGAELSAADEQILRELTERARTGGLKLTGEGGLLGGNSRNGRRASACRSAYRPLQSRDVSRIRCAAPTSPQQMAVNITASSDGPGACAWREGRSPMRHG